MLVIGNKDSLHFHIDPKTKSGLSQIDIWFGEELLTPIDNIAYLPQFVSSLKEELLQLERRDINSDGFFLNLGPTTDDCSSRIKLIGEEAKVTFELEEGTVHLLHTSVSYLIGVYSEVVKRLEVDVMN